MKIRRLKEKPVDRRIQKTKKILSEALSSLIVEKGYDAVSIKDIIERANVGRSTFYAHFEDKEQLLLSGHDTFKRIDAGSTSPRLRGAERVGIDFLFLYKHVQEQSRLTTALLREKGGDIVQSHVYGIFAQKITEYFTEHGSSETDPVMFAIMVHVSASAMLSLLVQWMEQKMPYPPEEMAQRSEALLMKMMG